MKKHTIIPIIVMALWCARSVHAQQRGRGASTPAPASTGDYATDVGVVLDSEGQALEQAQQMLASGTGTADRDALETAIKEMEHSRAALEDAGFEVVTSTPEEFASVVKMSLERYKKITAAAGIEAQ